MEVSERMFTIIDIYVKQSNVATCLNTDIYIYMNIYQFKITGVKSFEKINLKKELI